MLKLLISQCIIVLIVFYYTLIPKFYTDGLCKNASPEVFIFLSSELMNIKRLFLSHTPVSGASSLGVLT